MITDYDVARAMIRSGGSFVQALGEAFLRADADNHARLRRAFPGYWDRYSEIAERHAAPQPEAPQ